jgi:hypothetical protein
VLRHILPLFALVPDSRFCCAVSLPTAGSLRLAHGNDLIWHARFDLGLWYNYYGVVMSGEDAPMLYLENLIVHTRNKNKQTNERCRNVYISDLLWKHY